MNGRLNVYLVVVLIADGCELLGTVVPHATQIPDLARVALLDAIHLLVAVLADAVHLAVVVVAESVELLALVLLYGF